MANKDGDLFDRVILAESGGKQFDPKGNILTSNKGALGISQTLSGTAYDPGYGIPDIFSFADQFKIPYKNRSEESARYLLGNEKINRAFGKSYLEGMLARYNGDEERALVAYNWGPSNADKWDGKRESLPKETRNYVTKILSSAPTTKLVESTAKEENPFARFVKLIEDEKNPFARFVKPIAEEENPFARFVNKNYRMAEGGLAEVEENPFARFVSPIPEKEEEENPFARFVTATPEEEKNPFARFVTVTPEAEAPEAPEDRDGLPFFRELGPGFSAAIDRIGAIPDRLGMQYDAMNIDRNSALKAIYDRIDAGERFDYGSASELAKGYTTISPDQILRYQDLTAERRKTVKSNLENTIAKDVESFNENYEESLKVAEETSARDAPRIGRASDIRSFEDFLDYAGYMIGSGAAEYLPVLVGGIGGGVVGGPFGAFVGAGTVSTVQALPEQSQQRLEYILKTTENMTSQEERADAIIKYLSDTAQTSTLVALGQGALDVFGPTRVLSGLFKKKLATEAGEKAIQKSETVRQAAWEALRQTPRAMGEEAVTGALQQVADMAGQYYLEERTGDIFTGDNLVEVVDSAIAEAIGSLGAQGVNIATAAGKQKLANDAMAQLKKKIDAEEQFIDAETLEISPTFDMERFTVLYENNLAAGQSETDAFKNAGRELNEERKATDEVNQDIKVESPEENVSASAESGVETPTASTEGTIEGDIQRKVGDTVTVYDQEGKPKEAVVSAVSEAGTIKVDVDGQEQLVDTNSDYSLENPLATDYSLSTEAIDGRKPKITEWSDKELKALLNKRKKQIADPEVAKQRQRELTRDIGAIIAEQKRRADTQAKPTEQTAEQPRINVKDTKFNRASVRFGNSLINQENYSTSTVQAILAKAKEIKLAQEADEAARKVAESLDPNAFPTKEQNDAIKRAEESANRTVLTNNQILERATQEILDEYETNNVSPFVSSDPFEDASGQVNADEEIAEADIENQGDAIGDGSNRSNDLLDGEQTADVETNLDRSPQNVQTSRRSSKKPSTPKIDPIYDTQAEIANEGITRDVRGVDILDAIRRSKDSTPFEKQLALRLKPFLTDVAVRFVDAANMGENAGSYTETAAGDRVINLSRSADANDGRNNQTFLHEALHGATARIIAQYNRDPSVLPIKQQKAVAELQKLTDRARAHLEKKRSNGTLSAQEQLFLNAGAFSNVSEFVSYGMSHPGMQEVLQTIPATNTNQGFLSKFVKAIRDLFGLEGKIGSAFEQLIILTDRILDPKAFGLSPPADIVAYAKKQSQTEATTLRKLFASKSPITFLDAMSNVYKLRSLDDTLDFFRDIKDSITIPSLKAILYSLPTQSIIDMGSRFYGLKGLRRIQGVIRRIAGERNQRLLRLSAEAKIYSDFVRKFGPKINRELSDSMSLSTLFDIDGNKFGTLAQALANDKKLQEFTALINNTKESENKRKYGKREATKRMTQLRIFYKGFMTAKNNQDEYQGWEQLNKDTKGEAAKVYKMVKLRYRENYKEYYQALVKRIRNSTEHSEEAKKNILQTIESEMLREIDFGVYFPLMRFGDYYLDYGKGSTRAFEMFESSVARNNRKTEIINEYKRKNPQDTRSREEIENEIITSIGDNIQLRDQLSGRAGKADSEMIRKIFKLIDDNTEVDPLNQQRSLNNTQLIKNEIYQLYLRTLPEQSMRRRFIRRKGTAGFSGDAFRIFISTNQQATNQLAKIKFDSELRGTIAAAYDELKGRGGQNLLKARAYVDRVVTRALDDAHGDPLTAPAIENIVRFGNQAAFYYYLTSAKSALVQFTQLPIVGLPVLAAKFGMAKAFGNSMKYLNLYNNLASFKVGEDGQLRMSFERPDLTKTRHVLKDIPPDKREWYINAINSADRLNMFNALFAAEVGGQRARVPTNTYNSVVSRGTRTMLKFMSGAFYEAERASRQLMFMNALDLEMEQQLRGYERELAKIMEANPSMTRAQAVEALYAPYRKMTSEIKALLNDNKVLVDSGRYNAEDAVSELLGKDKKISSPRAAARRATLNAIDLSYEALFDYGQFNKAELLKGRGALALIRIPAQFMTFPINMTVFMARNFYGMIPFIKGNANKREAAIKFFGAQGMAFLFAGATGLWQYSTLMGLLEGMREMFRPDDEEEDEWYDEDDDGNPLGKRNLDLWFREWFIPTYFGPDSSLANAFGLTREQALTLQRAVKLGPISAITDWNIGASTSLDGLFFTSGRSSDDLKEMFSRGLKEKALGPAGNLFFDDFWTAFTEDFANGDFKKGAEKMLPAAVRGLVKSSRLAEEGERTRQLNTLREAEWYHTGKLIGTALGFSSTEVAEIREKNMLAKDLETAILKEKTELLAKYDKALVDLDTRGTKEAEQRMEDIWVEIGRFNVRNGMYAITTDTLYNSLTQKQKSRANAGYAEGLMFKSPNSNYAILPLLFKSAVYPELEQ